MQIVGLLPTGPNAFPDMRAHMACISAIWHVYQQTLSRTHTLASAGKAASPEGLWTAKIVDFGLSKVVAQQRQRALRHMLTRSASKRSLALAVALAAGTRPTGTNALTSSEQADLAAAANGRDTAPRSGEVLRSGRVAEFWSGKLGLVQRSGGSGSSAVQRTPSATTVGAGAVSNLSAVDAPAHGTGTSQQEGHSAR